MIAAARTGPQKAGRPYSHWTLSRLVEYIIKELKIAISRAQLARVLEEDGLRWYQSPPNNTHVLCINELGPLSAKTYPARCWPAVGQPPRVEPDYGRRAKQWTFGAFEPHTGEALPVCTKRRRSCDFTAFLDQVVSIGQTVGSS